MRTYGSLVPAGSRPGSRLPQAHIYATPVVREQPRPTPSGFGSSTW